VGMYVCAGLHLGVGVGADAAPPGQSLQTSNHKVTFSVSSQAEACNLTDTGRIQIL
jgi:hypothetical protein